MRKKSWRTPNRNWRTAGRNMRKTGRSWRRRRPMPGKNWRMPGKNWRIWNHRKPTCSAGIKISDMPALKATRISWKGLPMCFLFSFSWWRHWFVLPRWLEWWRNRGRRLVFSRLWAMGRLPLWANTSFIQEAPPYWGAVSDSSSVLMYSLWLSGVHTGWCTVWGIFRLFWTGSWALFPWPYRLYVPWEPR